MIWSWGLALALVLGSAAQATLGPSADLAAAKTLYASGSYEEALAKLATATAPETVDEADQYRALCLLALGRTTETERSLETLITRRPLFRMSETEVSPRLVTMFRTARKRLLPDVARTLYARAKSSFDRKEFAPAAADLKTLLQLLSDEDMERDSPAASDLAMLADGFLRLATAELESKPATAPAAVAAAAPAPAAPPPAPEPAGPREPAIYTIGDLGVAPPLDLTRQLPPWRPPNAVMAAREYRGVLRLVINEQGRVDSATLPQPINSSYDPMLLSAARQWLFRPALKDGAPVKYSKDIPIVLSPVAR